MTLALYGHPFSSYTWKVLIALYANGTPFEFRMVDPDHPEHAETVRTASPQGKFPVLADGDNLIFETSPIIEYLDAHVAGDHRFVPNDTDAAIEVRMLDRVFDHYVMNVMQVVVDEHIRSGLDADPARCEEARARLRRTYDWLENWLQYYPERERITLVECAAAPSLFYADWVEEIGAAWPRLKVWRRHLLSIPAVKRCVDDARPYRHFFPLGAPDRD
jgi:glutathione S-transferase